MPDLSKIKPNRKKAVLFAAKQLPELVCDAVKLEGVNFTLPEVKTLLDGVTVGGHRLEDETIALNQAEAWRFLFKRLETDEFNLSESFVCELHGILAKREALSWGKFRDGGVTIAGTDYEPPKAAELDDRWRKLEEKHSALLYQREADIEQTYANSVSLFLQMARTQFFYDDNKRIGRIMMNGILLSCGLPVINLPASKQLEFNRLMIDFYQTGDELPMQTLMLNCLDPRTVEIMAEG